MKLRILFFALTLLGAAAGGYALAPAPEVRLPPTLVTVTLCSPSVGIGYILVQPDGYVGGIETLSPEAAKAAETLQESGRLRRGEIHFKGPFQCPAL